MRKFCHQCGAKYIGPKAQPQVCSGCKHQYFENPSPTVDIILFNENEEVLIAQRAREPQKGKYDFLGGFVELNESFEEALLREVAEESGLSAGDFSTPEYVASHSVKYLFKGEEKALIPAIFTAKLLSKKALIPNDDVASTKFVKISDLDRVDFSRPDYPEIARKAHKIIFGK